MGAFRKESEDRSGWQPSPDQELLLRAALWQGDAARTAWEEWTARANFFELKRAERRILPLVYLNLSDIGLEPASREYLAETYYSFREHTELVMRRASAAIQTLSQAGIATLVLKGIALIALYYHDPGSRPTRDIDILVPTEQARDAFHVLYDAGWSPEDRSVETFDDAYLNRHYAHTLRSAEQIQLDLHRHVLHMEARPDEDADFWSAAIHTQLEGIETKALNPADQLLHICIHGSRWNVVVAPIRWVADASVLLQNAVIDWERLLHQTQQRQLITPVRTLLSYLRASFGAPVPDEFLQRLSSMKTSSWDRLQFEIYALPPKEHNTLRKLRYHYQQYRHLSSDYANVPWFWRFPRFLRDTWGLQNTRQVPLHVLRYLLFRPEHTIRRVAHGEGVPTSRAGM